MLTLLVGGCWLGGEDVDAMAAFAGGNDARMGEFCGQAQLALGSASGEVGQPGIVYHPHETMFLNVLAGCGKPVATAFLMRLVEGYTLLAAYHLQLAFGTEAMVDVVEQRLGGTEVQVVELNATCVQLPLLLLGGKPFLRLVHEPFVASFPGSDGDADGAYSRQGDAAYLRQPFCQALSHFRHGCLNDCLAQSRVASHVVNERLCGVAAIEQHFVHLAHFLGFRVAQVSDGLFIVL